MKQNVSELLPKLTDWLESHKEEMFADIAELVAVPSICDEGAEGYPYGPKCAEVLLKMAGLAQKYGFTWRLHGWHAVSISYGQGERQLGIWGHLDVVQVGEGWIYGPFQCKQVENYLIGRGTQDNKGPDVGSLYILRYLKEHDIVPPFEIRLIYGCQEESGMKDAVNYLKMEKAPDYSFVPDCGFPVCYGEKGFLELMLTSEDVGEAVEKLQAGTAVNAIPGTAEAVICGKHIEGVGVGGHSAYPDKCSNALKSLAEQCLEIDGLNEAAKKGFDFLKEAGSDGYGIAIGMDRSDEPSGPMTCAPTMLSLEDGCMKIAVNIRYPITMTSETIIRDMERQAASYGLHVELMRDSAPNYENPNSPWVEYLTQVYADVMGERLEPHVMSGGTYARKIPNAVGFGPGLPKDLTVLGLPEGHGECHQPDESQCIDTLFQAWKIYMTTVLRLIETGLPE